MEADKPAPGKEEKATQLLDELFRKTKARPSVYWLPLTEAQVHTHAVCMYQEGRREGKGGRERRGEEESGW